MLPQNIDALISFSAGVYCTYIAYRGVPVGTQKPYEWQQWHAKWGTLLKIAGPILIATALLQVLFKLAA